MKIYGTIEKSEKQADGTMIVMGYASSESKDVDGEIIKADAIRNAIPSYMKFANVREMHKADKASGTVLEMEVQADGRTWVKTHIVDGEACKKVEHKVYKGFSIGGRVTERDADDKTIIKAITLSELSLVDRPANPDSVFTFAKVDAAEGDGAGAGVDATAEKPADAATEGAANTEANKEDNAADKPLENKEENAAANSNEDANKDANADKAAGKTDDLKKGMWGISNFASILASINSLQESAEWEAESEGDGSTMPAELKAWLKSGGELLKAMVTEEVAEMVAEDEAVVVEVIALADKAKNLMKAACSPEDAEKFAKGFDALASRRDVLAKAGKRNSAADQKHLDAIHDAACAMGAACDAGTDKSAGKSDDLKKVAGWLQEVAKAVGAGKDEDIVAKVTELVDVAETLGKRVGELEAMPKPAKAVLKVVGKGEDNSTPEKNDETTVNKSDTPTDAMKKVWRGGGKVV